MKTTKIYGFLSFIIGTLFITSCINDGEFSTPNILVEVPSITVNSSIIAVKSALKQEFIGQDNLVYTFREGDSLFLEGYVVSSDATGNFYKKVILQDSPENPKAGIEIILNKTSLSETYDVGRKVAVFLDGLSVSYDDGELNIDPTNGIVGKYILGTLVGQQVDDIPSTEVAKHLFRSDSLATIIPTVINLAEINEAHVNTMIQMPAAQFLKKDLEKTFAGEANDEFDGFRNILECETERIIKLQTSTYSSFKSNVIPVGKGAAHFILSKDYTSEFIVAIVNSPADLDFTDSNRCDPIELDCGYAATEGANTLFYEDFENQSNSSLIAGNGWTNFIEEGTEAWEAYTSSGNNPSLGISARIGSFSSNDRKTISWLITPGINLSENTGVAIKFQTSNSYADDSDLTLLFSNDWDGTTSGVSAATWGHVSKAYITQNTDSFSNWFDSGLVDLSCGNGTTYFAFKYTGSGNASEDGTFELDNIQISSN